MKRLSQMLMLLLISASELRNWSRNALLRCKPTPKTQGMALKQDMPMAAAVKDACKLTAHINEKYT